ncbi:myo-inositol-1(or 4)-monophosphatase [Aliiruegeria haliotis]|uniref:Myo-inositol-1(Or 4)-monophosphatase n=1 Tax=Aliiruegeria haliotis TaxID=1280846 RepID=A0A2T0RSR1_9RHOB|nr:3'(2'),5'-bisphosphate nucleotidase CysQ [Aliiruegeria haliotis]PRY24208.1 myo-inositol-1(or 4)-monophosphatase [Aliiruegeria haliotis]
MPGSDLALLVDVARSAGEIACRHWQEDHAVWDKGAGQGPVTEADLEVDCMLEDRLLKARPSYGWMSEESADNTARLKCERVFVVDPIDGTRAFTEGQKTWAHSLAVVEDGVAVTAVVYLPLLDKLYTAERDVGAWLNGEPIRASDRTDVRGAEVLMARAAMEPHHWPGGVPDLKRRFRSSLAYRLALVGEGRFDGMLTLRESWEWDIAAGGLIAAEAGALVTDRIGRPLAFNSLTRMSVGVVCAAPGVHTALMAGLTGRG